MFLRSRLIWSRLCRLGLKNEAYPNSRSAPLWRMKTLVPCSFGFSLFTWIGFDKTLTAEDELIDTIKHCVLFIKKLEYVKAERLLHVALRQAQQLQHQPGITYIYDVMANLALEREQLDKAKQLFVAVTQRIMADGAKEEDPRVIHISLKLARISHLQKNFETAQLGYEWCIERLNKCLTENCTEENKTLLALAEDWYGRLCLDCNQNKQGLKLLINALDRMREVNIDKEHIVIQLNDVGTVCDRLDRTDESIEYFKEAIDIGRNIPKMEELGVMYVNLGRAYIKKNLLNEARKSCGLAWKFGTQKKIDDVRKEAEDCLKHIRSLS